MGIADMVTLHKQWNFLNSSSTRLFTETGFIITLFS
jgi:hypothetical protein